MSLAAGDASSTITSGSSILALPWEILDLILDHLFSPTGYDYPGSSRAELRIYVDHVLLRRISPNPPARFKGCRSLMRSCKLMNAHVLEYMYSRLEFDVKIHGSEADPGPRFNRLTSEYPLGRTSTCAPLKHLRNLSLFLCASSDEEVERLKMRLSEFLEAIKTNPGLRIRFIGFYCTNSGTSLGSADEVANMLGTLKSQTLVHVYNQLEAVSKHCLHGLLEAVDGVERDQRNGQIACLDGEPTPSKSLPTPKIP